MQAQKSKPKQKQYVDLNPIESFRDIGSSTFDSIKNDFFKSSGSDMWDQILGVEHQASETSRNAGELAEGEELDLSTLSENKAKPHIEAGIEYHREIIHAGKREIQREQLEISTQVQQIQAELKKIMSMSKELQSQFKQAASEQRVVVAGKYHETFFAFLLTTIREAKRKIEDAGAWLSAMKGKKKKQDYWGMFKKHGTTFGLSNERVVATQTG